MKTLITGTPGWLGNRIVEVLTDSSSPLNQYSSSKERQIRCLVLPGMDTTWLESRNVQIIKGDIRQVSGLRDAVKGIDSVLHCAGIIHPRTVPQFYDINYRGTRNILQASSESGVRRIIYISSNSAAGVNPNSHMLMSEQSIAQPYKNYGKSKLKAENEVLDYIRRGKIDGVILRPCWYYGPGQPERQTRFFEMIRRGNPILFGNGQNLRSMTYIDNLIQAILLAEGNDNANGEVYWIADRRPYKTIEIYETIANLLEVRDFTPRHVPALASSIFEKVDDIIQGLGFYQTEIHVAGEMTKNIACSVGKAEKQLGYDPKIDLLEGMKISIDWSYKYGHLQR